MADVFIFYNFIESARLKEGIILSGLNDYAVLCFGSLFVIVDPITLVPTYLAMTGGNTVQEKIRMAGVASTIAFFILVLFSLSGQWIFKAFGITLPAFQIAGGIILMVVALDMLQARRTAVKQTTEEQEEGTNKDDVAVTPLAIPMLAGPGAITAVILLSSKAVSIEYLWVLLGNILIVSLISFAILRFAAIRSHLLSVIVMKVMTRLMGLLLAVISVQFILNGVTQVLVTTSK